MADFDPISPLVPTWPARRLEDRPKQNRRQRDDQDDKPSRRHDGDDDDTPPTIDEYARGAVSGFDSQPDRSIPSV